MSGNFITWDEYVVESDDAGLGCPTAAKGRIKRRKYKTTSLTSPTSRWLRRWIFTFVLMALSVLPGCNGSCLPSSRRCSTSCRRTSIWPAHRRQRARSVSCSVSCGCNTETPLPTVLPLMLLTVRRCGTVRDKMIQSCLCLPSVALGSGTTFLH
jgi:hypothetical protein